jgi:hypothetical protein
VSQHTIRPMAVFRRSMARASASRAFKVDGRGQGWEPGVDVGPRGGGGAMSSTAAAAVPTAPA